MKKLSIIAVMATVMVFAATFASCEKENEDFTNVQRSTVESADPIVVTDTTVITDTVVIDTVGGRKIIVVDYHKNYGQWVVSGNNATINATHIVKQIVVPDSGASYVVDSISFTEVGTMVWQFQPSYSGSQDGTHPATESGCSALSATCTYNWVYNVPEEYAPYFEGHCELVPTTVTVNGTTATVKTTNGTTSRTAAFTLNIEGPQQPTVVSRSAYWRHMHDCGQWTGNGATRNITLHCWCVETTNWSDGSTTKDSVLVAGHGTMSWSFPSYDHSVDGNYTANASGCSALQATCNVSYTYDVANILGRTYTHGTACGPMPTTVSVNGTTATVTTNSPLRQAVYSLTIVTPTPADTTVIFGNIKYVARHYSAVDYYVGAAGDGWYILVIDENNNWYTSPDASTASGLNFTMRGTLTASEYAHIVSVSNFTAANYSGNRKCAAWCRNSSAGATANVISVVEYHPNGGEPQIKYRNMSGALIGVCSAVTGTIQGQTVPEPVSWGGITTSFTLGGVVVK